MDGYSAQVPASSGSSISSTNSHIASENGVYQNGYLKLLTRFLWENRKKEFSGL
jgi:hypothetical protein